MARGSSNKRLRFKELKKARSFRTSPQAHPSHPITPSDTVEDSLEDACTTTPLEECSREYPTQLRNPPLSKPSPNIPARTVVCDITDLDRDVSNRFESPRARKSLFAAKHLVAAVKKNRGEPQRNTVDQTTHSSLSVQSSASSSTFLTQVLTLKKAAMIDTVKKNRQERVFSSSETPKNLRTTVTKPEAEKETKSRAEKRINNRANERTTNRAERRVSTRIERVSTFLPRTPPSRKFLPAHSPSPLRQRQNNTPASKKAKDRSLSPLRQRQTNTPASRKAKDSNLSPLRQRQTNMPASRKAKDSIHFPLRQRRTNTPAIGKTKDSNPSPLRQRQNNTPASGKTKDMNMSKYLSKSKQPSKLHATPRKREPLMRCMSQEPSGNEYKEVWKVPSWQNQECRMKIKLSKHLHGKTIPKSVKEQRKKRIARRLSALDTSSSKNYDTISEGLSESGDESHSTGDSSGTYINISDNSETYLSIPSVVRAVISRPVLYSYAQDHDPAEDNQNRKPIKYCRSTKHIDEPSACDLSYDTSISSSSVSESNRPHESNTSPVNQQKTEPIKRGSPKLAILPQNPTHRMPISRQKHSVINSSTLNLEVPPTNSKPLLSRSRSPQGTLSFPLSASPPPSPNHRWKDNLIEHNLPPIKALPQKLKDYDGSSREYLGEASDAIDNLSHGSTPLSQEGMTSRTECKTFSVQHLPVQSRGTNSSANSSSSISNKNHPILKHAKNTSVYNDHTLRQDEHTSVYSDSSLMNLDCRNSVQGSIQPHIRHSASRQVREKQVMRSKVEYKSCDLNLKEYENASTYSDPTLKQGEFASVISDYLMHSDDRNYAQTSMQPQLQNVTSWQLLEESLNSSTHEDKSDECHDTMSVSQAQLQNVTSWQLLEESLNSSTHEDKSDERHDTMCASQTYFSFSGPGDHSINPTVFGEEEVMKSTPPPPAPLKNSKNLIVSNQNDLPFRQDSSMRTSLHENIFAPTSNKISSPHENMEYNTENVRYSSNLSVLQEIETECLTKDIPNSFNEVLPYAQKLSSNKPIFRRLEREESKLQNGQNHVQLNQTESTKSMVSSDSCAVRQLEVVNQNLQVQLSVMMKKLEDSDAHMNQLQNKLKFLSSSNLEFLSTSEINC